MKKTTLTRGRISCLAALFMGCIGFQSVSDAQTFNPPMGYEDSWPSAGMGGMGPFEHTSAYSYLDPTVNADLVLSGWDDASGSNAGVGWRYMPVGNPSGVFAQGTLSYSNARDIEVGCLDVGGSTQLLVAYYDIGVGHKVDVYKINPSGTAYLYTKILSSIPMYTRISIDCHLNYAAAITWEDWQGMINTVMLLNGPAITFSGVLTLPNTGRCTMPDCAFSHTPSGLNVHYSYYDYGKTAIIETDGDFWTMITMGGGLAPTTIMDINYVKPAAYTNIDCPGHYDAKNWAYTYTLDMQNISVRLIDYHSTATPTTIVVNDAVTLPSKPINNYKNLYPFCAYDNGHITSGVSGIYVGWHTYAPDPMTGGIAGYVALHMKESGLGLISTLDYLTVANNPTWSAWAPILSFSKQDDFFGSLYTVFPEVDPSGLFQLQNKYHVWGTPAFKTADNGNVVHCDDASRIAAFNSQRHTAQISAFPNPFSERILVDIPADAQGGSAEAMVMDLTGKNYGSYTGSASGINAYLAEVNAKLVPGIYFLKVTLQGKDPETLKITKM